MLDRRPIEALPLCRNKCKTKKRLTLMQIQKLSSSPVHSTGLSFKFCFQSIHLFWFCGNHNTRSLFRCQNTVELYFRSKRIFVSSEPVASSMLRADCSWGIHFLNYSHYRWNRCWPIERGGFAVAYTSRLRNGIIESSMKTPIIDESMKSIIVGMHIKTRTDSPILC